MALLGLACLFSAAAGRLSYIVRPFDSDGAMFIYSGKVVASGGRFCHDLCDNKFPTTALMTGLCWRALGTHWAGYVWLEAGLALGGALLLMRTARRHAGPFAALPTFLFALVYLNANHAVFGGFQLETPQAFFAVVSAVFAAEALAADRPAAGFVAGLAAGCAAMWKPTGLAVAGAYALAVLFCTFGPWRGRRGLPRAVGRGALHGLALAAGVAAVAAAVVYYLAQAQILADMPGLYRQISTYAKETSWEALDLMKLPVVGVMVGFPMLVRGLIFRRQPDRLEAGGDGITKAARDVPRRDTDANIPYPTLNTRHRSRNRSRNTQRAGRGGLAFDNGVNAARKSAGVFLWFALAWLAVEAVGVVGQRRMYAYHFLVLAPPAALLFGMIPRRVRALPLLAALFPFVMLSVVGGAAVLEIGRRPARLELSDYLAARAAPTDAVWMDDMPRLLLETGLRPGSRYPITFPFTNSDSAPLEMGGIILADLAEREPAYVVLRTRLEELLKFRCDNISELSRKPARRENYMKAWRAIRAYVDQHYAEEARVGGDTVYRRRG